VEQSGLFKKVYAECLGTFGGDSVGLIVADFYLTPEQDDVELAKGLASVAAAAGAPALVGVSPDFPSSSDAWFANCRERDSRFLFPLLPRWRSAAGYIDGQPWIHPGYLIAARVAAAVRSCNFEAASANLLPHWSPTRAEAFAATAADVFWDVEFESAFEGPRTIELRHAGVNAVSVPSLSQRDAFGMLSPAISRSRPRTADNLAHLLLTGHIHRHLQDIVRRHRHSDSGYALSRVVHRWFPAHYSARGASEPLLRLRNVAILPDKVVVAIAWHTEAGGILEEIELSVPGIFDDRTAVH
jgi:hypothetical protein